VPSRKSLKNDEDQNSLGRFGLATQPGNYRHGLDLVHVMIGDIKACQGKSGRRVLPAIRPDFYSDATPYLLTYVEFPDQ